MRAEALRLASEAARSFSFRRLYLIGSAVQPSRPLSVWSDLDLVVEGLDVRDYLRLAAALQAQTRYPVDLKPLEELAPEAQRGVAAAGILLYERG